MKRLIDWHLLEWKKALHRKPLLLRGARQVGKTYAIRKLGEEFENFLEINFELTPDAKKIFEKDLRPDRILREIHLFSGEKITPGKTLLFFDEIQEAPKAIQALRYFYEKISDLHVIAAGSLLDFALEEIGIPVGRISSLYLYPLSFLEFLSAIGENHLIQPLLEQNLAEPISDIIHKKSLALVGQYLAIGGMPEAVARWNASQNPREIFQVHHDLIEGYRQDFQKYAKKHQIKYLERLFTQIPRMVGEQFQYKNIDQDFKKRELSPCLDLLCKANIIHRIFHSPGQGIPLGAEINLNWFKLIFIDVALCQAILGFDLSTWFLEPGLEFINRGAISEAFIGQELLCYGQPSKKLDLYFWRRIQRGSSAEIDYLHESEKKIIPIEVKSGHNGRLKSMHLFLDTHEETPYGIRFSAHNYSIRENICSLPLYAVGALAHETQKESLEQLYQE
ncbi:MAG: AAA family ATPase [Simkaniaceae bacterium]|nr:AAA family ATPase [Candidatus Sacchlamyda saccharinae]